jgi:hypothetical protein
MPRASRRRRVAVLSKPVACPKPSVSRSRIKGQADKQDAAQLREWKRQIWLRDEGKCRCCSVKVIKTLKLQPTRGEAHHIIGRANRSTRYDTRNGLLLCRTCHDRVTGAVNDRLFLHGTAWFTNGDGGRYVNADHQVRFTR